MDAAVQTPKLRLNTDGALQLKTVGRTSGPLHVWKLLHVLSSGTAA